MGLRDNGFDPEIATVFETGAVSSLVSVLLDIRHEPHSASDICKYADISRATFYQHVDRLEEYGILEHTDHGSASGYCLANTAVATQLIELEGVLEEHQHEQRTAENEPTA